MNCGDLQPLLRDAHEARRITRSVPFANLPWPDTGDPDG
jgi:hypothetical protein